MKATKRRADEMTGETATAETATAETATENKPRSNANDARKEKALAALLDAPTIKDAAKVAGVGESTLLRWLKEPEFKSDYRDARREIVTHATSRLQAACGDAVSTLREIATDADAPPSSRVSAARAILETSIKAVELEDLAARIEALEALQEAARNTPQRW